MNAVIPAPKALSLSPEERSNNWDLFEQSWNNYELATGLRSKPNEQRLATLLSIVGYDALHVYNAFYWAENEPKTIENVLLKFRVYCKPKKNVTYERFVFMSRKQKCKESINDFLPSNVNMEA